MRAAPPMEALAQLVLLLLVIINAQHASGEDFYECIPGIPSPGVSIPKGDIDVKVGAPEFPLFCHLNPNHQYYAQDGVRSNSLGFFAMTSSGSWQSLAAEVVNDTTIRAIYSPSAVIQDKIECRVRDANGDSKGICLQNINVGYEPLKPENFTCISDNWQSLNCTWDIPYNPVKTDYRLYFSEPGKMGRAYDCLPAAAVVASSKAFEAASSKSSHCYIDSRSDPIYRRFWETYRFYIAMNNSLRVDHDHDPIDLDHFSVVRPNPPSAVTMESSSPDSIHLWYKIDEKLHFFPPGLRQDVKVRSEFDPEDHWQTLPIPYVNTQNDVQDVNYTLTGLNPFTTYTLKIRMQSMKANPNETHLWSQMVVKEGMTLPATPEWPPEVTSGSFEVVSHDLQKRSIYVYWKQLPRWRQNGPDFKYVITEVTEGGKKRPIVATKITKSYALFSGLKMVNYTFDITTQNRVGTAPKTSSVAVPHHDETRGLQPRSFTKIAYSDQLFEVSWLPPIDEAQVVSYTVFWCLSENNRDRPYQCEGQLNWTLVDKANRSTNVTLPTSNVYQFAVAANTQKLSSGMVWSTCTVLHNKVVGKLKTVTVDVVKKTSMVIRWRLDCSDRVGMVIGYKVVYCPVDEKLECLNSHQFEDETTEDHATITNLEPWTTYKVAVAVMTKAGASELSDFLVNQTSRDRPGGPPTNIQLMTAGANSVKVTWDEPVKPNGPISDYQIRYGYMDHRRDYIERMANSSSKYVLLESLAFNANYDIKVRACARIADSLDPICGDWSAKRYQTGYGPSGPMPAPLVTFVNSTTCEVAWDQDSFHHGGPIRRFELRIVSQRTGTQYSQNIMGSNQRIRLELDKLDLSPDCANASVTNLYNFTIRSVTFEDQREFLSDWSNVEVVPAYCGSNVPWIMITSISVIIPIMGVIAMIYFCRCYKWGHDTTDIFKEVDKEAIDGSYKIAVASKLQPPSTVINGVHAEPKSSDWTEMQDMPSPQSGKRAAYQRAGSKDSMENLLNKERKVNNERGNSESTSGCDSGQNYESDDNFSSKSASQDPSASSSENLASSHSSSEANNDSGNQSIRTTQSPYVMQSFISSAPPPAGLATNEPTVPSPYSQLGANGLQTRPFDGGHHRLPSNSEGYTRATAVLFGPTSSTSIENLRPPRRLPLSAPFEEPTPSPGYVTLDRGDSRSFSPTSNDQSSLGSGSLTPIVMSPTTSTTMNFAVRPSGTNGYITVEEANHVKSIPENVIVSDPRAYSKVATLPDVSSSAVSSPSLAASPSSSAASSVASTVVVMSPKDLQVETKAPYSKVVTSVDGSSATTSTMV